MAMLIGPERQQRPLLTRTRIGRGPENDLRIEHAHVSRAHAQIVWDGLNWWLYDLGSRNGTTHNAQPVQGRPRLVRGDALHFGGCGPWQMAADEAPTAFAIGPNGVVRLAQGDLLGIPDERAPVAWLVREEDGWRLAWFDGRSTPMSGVRTVVVAGGLWLLGAPEPVEATLDRLPWPADPLAPTSAPTPGLTLHLRHSADEESIELTVLVNGQRHALGHRAHGALLLQLARASADSPRVGAPDGPVDHDHGWVYPELLEAQLGVSRAQLNMLVYRARRHFVDAGVPGAREIIGRQPGTCALRLQWPVVVEAPNGVTWQASAPPAPNPPTTVPPRAPRRPR